MFAQTIPVTLARPSARLIPLEQFAAHPPLPLKRPVTLVGSAEFAHVRLTSRTVSHAHALILNVDGRVYIRDLASRTGVRVNGQAVREANLCDGDEIRIGRFALRFAAEEPDFGAEPAPSEPDAYLVINGLDHVALSDTVVLIGRRPKADIRIPDGECELSHAVIFTLGGRRLLRDLKTKAKTFVNDRPVHQTELRPGHVIRIGQTSLEYLVPEAAARPVEAEVGAPEAIAPQIVEPAAPAAMEQSAPVGLPEIAVPPVEPVAREESAAAEAALAAEIFPEPVAVEPEPVAVEPEPVAVEPEPVAVEPEPVAVEPERAEAEAAPARAILPEPVVGPEPEPVAAEPEEGASLEPITNEAALPAADVGAPFPAEDLVEPVAFEELEEIPSTAAEAAVEAPPPVAAEPEVPAAIVPGGEALAESVSEAPPPPQASASEVEPVVEPAPPLSIELEPEFAPLPPLSDPVVELEPTPEAPAPEPAIEVAPPLPAPSEPEPVALEAASEPEPLEVAPPAEEAERYDMDGLTILDDEPSAAQELLEPASERAEETFAPVEDTFAPVEEAVTRVGESFTPFEEAAAPVEEAVTRVDEPFSPFEEAAAPVEEPLAPVAEAAVPVDEAVPPVNETLSPVEESPALVEQPPAPVGEPSAPVGGPETPPAESSLSANESALEIEVAPELPEEPASVETQFEAPDPTPVSELPPALEPGPEPQTPPVVAAAPVGPPASPLPPASRKEPAKSHPAAWGPLAAAIVHNEQSGPERRTSYGYAPVRRRKKSRWPWIVLMAVVLFAAVAIFLIATKRFDLTTLRFKM